MAPYRLIDTCCNLSHPSFANRERRIIERAQAVGVDTLITPASSLADAVQIVGLAEQHPEVHVAVGVHPHCAKTWQTNTYNALKQLAEHDKVVAIGETGLDYHRNYSSKQQQRLAFEQQIQLAIETNKPLLMHQRSAHQDFVRLLKPYRQQIKGGVVHCFTDQQPALTDYLDLDLHIGLTGWFCDERRGQHLRTLIKAIPLKRLMLETDAPYLRPRHIAKAQKGEPHNEPALLTYIATDMAACLGLPVATLAAATTQTSRYFYRLA